MNITLISINTDSTLSRLNPTVVYRSKTSLTVMINNDAINSRSARVAKK